MFGLFLFSFFAFNEKRLGFNFLTLDVYGINT